MEKFVPRGKMSKKAKRELDKRKRVTWGALNPTTRKPENPKAYKRKKVQPEEEDAPPLNLFTSPRPIPAPAYTKASCHSASLKPTSTRSPASKIGRLTKRPSPASKSNCSSSLNCGSFWESPKLR